MPVRRRRIRWLAIAVAAVALASVLFFTLFFVVGGAFGTINDVGNAVLAVLEAVLVITLLESPSRSRPGLAALLVAAASIGAAISVVGSVLVISEVTGFYLAGLVSGLGFALIGIALAIAMRRRGSAAAEWPPAGRLRTAGLVSGCLMALGVLGVPGIVMRVDDPAAVPPWLYLGGAGWLGSYLVMPLWSLALAAAARRSGSEGVRQRLGVHNPQ